MTTRDELYSAAFRYKKTGLWKKLWDNDLFALKLKSGEIGYISIMGKNGDYRALGLYIGDEGIDSWRYIFENVDKQYESKFREQEIIMQQKCLQMVLDLKDFLKPEDVKEVRDYAKRNGIRLAGSYTYPQFQKFEPNHQPWNVLDKNDTSMLYEALEAAILFADLLKTETLDALGILPVVDDSTHVPLFSVKNGKLKREGMKVFPERIDRTFKNVVFENEFAIASAKRLRKKDTWEAELIRMVDAMQDDPKDAPYYPLLLMVVNSNSGIVLPGQVTIDGDENPEDILSGFLESAKEMKLFPKEIRCRDARTYALLHDLCEKVGAKIEVSPGPFFALSEAEKAFLNDSLPSDMEEQEMKEEMFSAIDRILSMNKRELQSMPFEMIQFLRYIALNSELPDGLGEKLWNKLDGLH